MGICKTNSRINNINNNSTINNNNNNSHNNNNFDNSKSDNNEIFDELSINIEQSDKILKQSKIYICKIHLDNFDQKKFGTGVLCKIPFPDKNNFLPVLITKAHVIEKDEALKNKKFEIIFGNGIVKNIIINPNRIIYSLIDNNNNNYDITIIEILPEKDKIFHFYDLEIFEDVNIIINEPVYIIQYPGGSKCSFSYGRILHVQDKKYICYNCSTEKGSSGGPILLLRNYNLIGIHEGNYDNTNYGSLLNKPLEKFYEENKNKRNKNIFFGCIICEYNVESNEEFNLLNDYNNKNLGDNTELNRLYFEGKKKKKLLEEYLYIYIYN